MVRCLVPHLPALAVCLTLVQLLSPCSGDFAVVGPPEPILAMVGGDADLPCHLSPKRSAETLQLMWVRPSRRQVLHTYAHGQEDTPAEEYRGRTSVLREDVTAGTAALRIHDVTVSDNGTYVCYFQDEDFYAKGQVELQVAALGSDPHIEMKGYEAGGIRVNCTSAGWYPQPQIEWRDSRGQNLSSEAVGEAVDPQGLYAASASVILEEGSGEGVSCVLRNPLLGQEKSARLSIGGPFFRNAEPWKVFVAPILLIGMLLLSGMSCFQWQWWKKIRALFQKKGREHELKKRPPGQSCSGWEAPKRHCRTSSSQGGTLPRAILPLPRDVARSSPAPGPETTPLLEPQGTVVTPSEDPEASGFELQAMVPAGGGASPEQALQTQVAPGTRTRLGQEPSVPRSSNVNKTTNRIYFEFGQEVPKSHWRMFMRLAGLEENDIVICEHENPGNLPEQHHGMLLRWQSKLGRAATPFRLMAALYKMQLRECLENIINKLAAEDILGSKDAEPRTSQPFLQQL